VIREFALRVLFLYFLSEISIEMVLHMANRDGRSC